MTTTLVPTGPEAVDNTMLAGARPALAGGALDVPVAMSAPTVMKASNVLLNQEIVTKDAPMFVPRRLPPGAGVL
ncbi:hypothetical protein [Glaciihabitans tibetensis]|uniref:hypothetical protein n=1 Tax=Glaciihabitans tibetensis TaxID=1266600 RepID=UPI0015E69450|nr:hypothetical protein [Glaciihabitans tibetensis]